MLTSVAYSFFLFCLSVAMQKKQVNMPNSLVIGTFYRLLGQLSEFSADEVEMQQKILQLLYHYSTSGNLVQEKIIRNKGVEPLVSKCLSSSKQSIVSKCLTLISALCSKNRIVADAFVKQGALWKIVTYLTDQNNDWKFKSYCASALSNLCEDSGNQLHIFLHYIRLELM